MKPIIGQEAVVPEYGLGRVVSIVHHIGKYALAYDIEVKPYICDYSMVFDAGNVKLVKIHYEEEV